MEEWRQIDELSYEVSNLGRVRNSATGYILKPSIHDNKYYRVTLTNPDKSKKHYKVHRLVAEAFVPNPMEKPQVNHKDGNKLNNYSLNLEWCSNKENALHAVQTGLINRLNKERVIEIYKACWIDQLSIYKVAKMFKVS